MKRLIINLALVIALICFCFSAYKLGSYAWHTHQAKQMSSELSSLAGTDSAPDALTITADSSVQETGTDSVQDQGAAMMQKYGRLYERNSDFIGWLSIEGTDISYNFIDAEDESALEAYLEKLQTFAVYYDADNLPQFGDEILTLSTCNYHTDDGRLALIAVRTDL